MAAIDNSQGYQYEFLNSIPEICYCKKCSVVARRLTVTSCCGESYCHTCIADIQQQDKPCPECGEQFTIYDQMKYQRQIRGLQVYCSMRWRGCDWSGTVEELDAHLDPDQENCQHVDTKCPLNCQKTIPKNKVEQHVAKECVKRNYFCQHCNFKATYEVVDTHLGECIYVPSQCPNLCGVTCKHKTMEDHLHTCHLEEVACKFSNMGCDERFIRKDQEEHARQNIENHLTLTATAVNNIMQQHQQKLLEQEHVIEKQKQKLHEQEQELQYQKDKLKGHDQKLQECKLSNEKMEQTIQELSQKTEKLEWKLQELNCIIEEQKLKIRELEQELQDQKQIFQNPEQTLQEQRQDHVRAFAEENSRKNKITSYDHLVSNRMMFEMGNFHKEKAKNEPGDWKSPAMYTHPDGYKFCIGIDANGCSITRGKAMNVDLWIMNGEYDDQLKWPTNVQFTLELVNHKGGENRKVTEYVTWEQPTESYQHVRSFSDLPLLQPHVFIEHTKLGGYLVNDTLYFQVTVDT